MMWNKIQLQVVSNTDQQPHCSSSSSSPPSLASWAYCCAPLPCPALTLSLTRLLVLGHSHVQAFADEVEVSKMAGNGDVLDTSEKRIKGGSSFTELFVNPGCHKLVGKLICGHVS